MRKGELRSTVALVVLIAALSAAPAAAQTAEIHLSVRYFQRDEAFRGSIYNQDLRRCEAFRVVKTWKQRKGRDLMIGRDRTDADADYEVGYADARGRFYATAPPKTFVTQTGEERTCPRLRSVTIRVD